MRELNASWLVQRIDVEAPGTLAAHDSRTWIVEPVDAWVPHVRFPLHVRTRTYSIRCVVQRRS